MRKLLAARWFWVTAAFAVINVVGLLVIVHRLGGVQRLLPPARTLVLRDVRQTDLTPDHQLRLALEFDDAVEPEEVREHLSLETGGGNSVPFEVESAQPANRILVRTESFDSSEVVATVRRHIVGLKNHGTLAADQTRRLHVDVALRVTSIGVDQWSGATPRLNVRTTRNLDPKRVKAFIQIEPEVAFSTNTTGSGVELSGPFEFGKRYTVKFLKGLPAESGAVLTKDVSRTVLIPDRRPSLAFKTQGVYLVKEGSRLLPLEAVNVREVEVVVEQVYENNVVHYLRTSSSWHQPSDLGRNVAKQKYACPSAPNEPKTLHVDLRGLLGPEAFGVFFVTAREVKAGARDGEYDYEWSRASARQLVLITDMGLSVKRSDGDLLVWVSALSSAAPVAGAQVAVFSRANQKLLDGTTDERGIMHFRQANLIGDRAPYAVIAAKAGDAAVIKLEECALDTSSFDTGGRQYLAKGYEAFVYTDRGIYRPGEPVHLRAIVRAPGPSLPAAFPLQFRLKRPDGAAWKSFTAMLTEWGSAEVEAPLPAYAMLGPYQVEVGLPDGGTLGGERFQVEEFMPDRMKVEVGAADRRYKSTEPLAFTVTAAHLFGSPAAGRDAEGRCRFDGEDFSHPDFKGYRFADHSRSHSATDWVEEGTLDDNGARVFNVKVPGGLKPASALSAVFTASVKELGGRAVTASIVRRVDVYPRYVGVKRDRTQHAALNVEERFSCVLITPDGARVPEGELKAAILRVTWNTVLKRVNNSYRYESQREERSVSKVDCGVLDGAASFGFTPQEYGEYRVVVEDPEGGAAADLAFYCSGNGEAPWAMARPDRLELVADRKSYQPGETARVLVKAPFPGTALVTLEGRRVHRAEVVQMAANTHEISLPVEATFGTNAYLSVAVIRKIEPESRWSTHRAYGVVPILLDQKSRQLAVKVQAPEDVRPGRSLRVAVEVKDAAGLGRRAEVTLAAVDEGICRLTRFVAPDPWSFFYAKRAVGVSAYDMYALLMPEIDRKKVGADSATGGDGSGADDQLRRLLNPVAADRVKPIALWKSRLVTDEAGRVECDLPIPAAFNGQLRLMAVAVAAQEFGSGESNVFVRQPFMLQASLPRFLAPGDEFEAPVSLFNHSVESGPAVLEVGVSANIELVSGKPGAVNLLPNGEKSLFLKLRAPKLPGVARVRLDATFGGEKAFDEVELSVRPTATLQYVSGSGRLMLENGKPGEARIPVPAGWMPSTDKYWLSAAPLPTLKFAAALRYVLHYPYGCVEQTTSSAFPLLYLSDIAAVVDPDRFTKDEVSVFVQAGIDRLLSMQVYGGAFAWWPGGGAPYPWGSCYATHFLVEAEKAGYTVPADAMDRALRYLERVLNMTEEGETGAAVKAYACFVLARAGRPNSSWTFRLYEDRERIPLYSRFHVAGALAMQNHRDLAATITQAAAPVPTDAKPDTGGVLHSAVREKAILLSTYVDTDPDNDRLPALVQEIEDAMRDGRWVSTQENAFALLALGKYANRLKGRPSSYRAELSFGGEKRTFTQAETIRLQPKNLGGQEVRLTASGTGPLYYYWAAEGVPQSGDMPAKDQGMRVRRTVLTRDGQEADLSRIRHGDVLVVQLSLQSDLPLQNVVVTDLLPAGFEIESVNAQGMATKRMHSRSGEQPAPPMEWFSPRRVEKRDDRLLVFTEVAGGGPRHYRYVVRAVTCGRFHLPPVAASCMYQPATASVHGAGEVRIVRD